MSVLKNIVSDPKLVYYYSQKAVRSIWIRRLTGGAIARLIGRRDYGGDAEASRQVAQELSDEGISFLPSLHLSKEALNEVFRHLADKPVVDLYDGKTSMFVEHGIPESFTKLSYRTSDILSCSPLMKLANDPLVLNAVTSALGARPSIGTVHARWTFGENNPVGAHIGYDDVYHRDADDWRFIKLFVYLTDTTQRSGAHCFVRKSHLSDKLMRRGPIPEEELAQCFKPDEVMTIEGDAGTAFLENTWGIHRQLMATEGRRLLFSVLYGLCPWLPWRLKQATLPLPSGFDPYVNRAFYIPPR